MCYMYDYQSGKGYKFGRGIACAFDVDKLAIKMNKSVGDEALILGENVVRKLIAFVAAWKLELTAKVVHDYLCDGFPWLCRALSRLRTEDADQESLAAAKRMEDSLMELDGCVARELRRRGREPRRSFRRAALIVGSVFKPGAFSPNRMPSVWKGKVTPETYRQMVLDRVCEAIRDPLVWLRDESRTLG